MNIESLHEEEEFGILSSDDLYLDCVLVKPQEVADDQIEVLYVWVPRFPLTKTTLINCARHDINAEWRQGRAAHLTFDLRGTGDSDGQLGDKHFDRDLEGIKLWATERFGEVDIVFQGQADGRGQPAVLPIRPGVIIEYYHYPAANQARPAAKKPHPPLFYISTPGNFGLVDDALCHRLAASGYEVFGIDPLRYLLHASINGRLKIKDQWADLEIFLKHISPGPVFIGQPLGAGLALLWTCGLEDVRGVISIGQAQAVFDAWHIFENDNPHSYFINRYLYQISPRPAVFVLIENNELGGNPREIAAFYATVSHPRLADKTKEVSPRYLLKLLAWIENEIGVDEK